MFPSHLACGNGKCDTIESCEKCPKRKKDDIPCIECPEDCCALEIAFIVGLVFAGLILIPVIIIVCVILMVTCVSNKVLV